MEDFHTRISPPTRKFFGLAGKSGLAVGVLTTGSLLVAFFYNNIKYIMSMAVRVKILLSLHQFLSLQVQLSVAR
jgi:hypothetical protein